MTPLRAPQADPLRLMFVVTEDWYFISHRLPIALAARDAGYEVFVATRTGQDADRITREGLVLVPLVEMRRTSRNPLRELMAVFELFRLYRRYRIDIVHHVALKPVVYGSIAAWLARIPRIVNALAGLGYVFASDRLNARMTRPMVRTLLRFALRAGRGLAVVQNPDDRRVLIKHGLVEESRIRLIRGAGVDLTCFSLAPVVGTPPIVLFAARMLWDKGVMDFVEAARKLRRQGVSASFVLAGAPDPGNPASVPVEQLEAWKESGDIEWWGHRSDMPSVFSRTAIVCLPSSYGEGVPKVLIEAAACGRPIVTYDVPGCREIVRHGENGILVRQGDVAGLADALATLLADPQKRFRMGARARRIVEEEFSLERVIRETLGVYAELRA